MKFKVGDEVEVIKGKHRGEIGFIVDTVICLTEDREYHSISKSEDGLPGCCVSEDSIELIPVRRSKAFNNLANTAAKEVLQEYQCDFSAPEVPFKVGDKIRINIINHYSSLNHDLKEFQGKIATIINPGCDDGCWDLEWDDGGISHDWNQFYFVRLPDAPTYFKVGDKVEVIKGPNRGKVGCIVSDRYRGVIDNTMYMISNDSGVSGWYAAADELELTSVRDGPQGQFKIKDRVAINLIRMPEWNGAKGYIEKVVNDHSYKVILDGNSTAIQFHSSQLDRLPNIVPQSDPPFSVGDKVQTIYGMGIISQANFSLDTDWMYRVVLDNGRSMTFAPMGLKFVAKPQFKIDDRIRITKGTHEDKYGRIRDINPDSEKALVAVDEGFVGTWPFEELELVTIRGEGSKNIAWGSDIDELDEETKKQVLIHGFKANKVILDEIQQIECKMCGGTGKLLMLNNYVPCDCTLSGTDTEK